MRKILVIVAVSSMAFSCKRHTCTCISYFSGKPSYTNTTYYRGFKSGASKRCQMTAVPLDPKGNGTICTLN